MTVIDYTGSRSFRMRLAFAAPRRAPFSVSHDLPPLNN
jgi:hypothetical protein